MLLGALVVLGGITTEENITIGSYDQSQLNLLPSSPGQLSLGAAGTGAPLAVFQQALRTVSYFTTSRM